MFLFYFVLIYDKDRRFFLRTKLIGYLFSIFEHFICFFIAIREIIPATPYYIYKGSPANVCGLGVDSR